MHRSTTALVGVICLCFAVSDVNAQSGSRGSSGGGSSSSSGSRSGGSGGGGIAASGGRSFGSSIRYRPTETEAERVARQWAQIAINNSQAEAARARAQRNVQAARKAYAEGNVAKQSRQISYRNRQEQRSADLRERNIQARQQRERDKASNAANLTIHWPQALQGKQYAERLAEIEAFGKLIAGTDVNNGVKAGFRTAVQGLAKQIMQNERQGIIKEDDSKQVRAFVRALNKNYGQFPNTVKPSLTVRDMRVSNM